MQFFRNNLTCNAVEPVLWDFKYAILDAGLHVVKSSRIQTGFISSNNVNFLSKNCYFKDYLVFRKKTVLVLKLIISYKLITTNYNNI